MTRCVQILFLAKGKAAHPFPRLFLTRKTAYVSFPHLFLRRNTAQGQLPRIEPQVAAVTYIHTYIVVFLHPYKHTHIHTYLCTKRQGDLQHGLHSYVHNVCRWIHVSELNFKCPVVHTSLSAACSLQDRCDSNSCWASLKCPRLSHAHTYIHTHIHTYICTCTHTYVHTCIHRKAKLQSLHTYVHAC